MKLIEDASYGLYPDRNIIVQLNSICDEIQFFTAEDEDHLKGWKENYGHELVAVWRVKSLKTIPK